MSRVQFNVKVTYANGETGIVEIRSVSADRAKAHAMKSITSRHGRPVSVEITSEDAR